MPVGVVGEKPRNRKKSSKTKSLEMKKGSLPVVLGIKAHQRPPRGAKGQGGQLHTNLADIRRKTNAVIHLRRVSPVYIEKKAYYRLARVEKGGTARP